MVEKIIYAWLLFWAAMLVAWIGIEVQMFLTGG